MSRVIAGIVVLLMVSGCVCAPETQPVNKPSIKLIEPKLADNCPKVTDKQALERCKAILKR